MDVPEAARRTARSIFERVGPVRRLLTAENQTDSQVIAEDHCPTWVPPGHYYSPIPSSEDINRHRSGLYSASHDELREGIDLRAERQLELLAQMAPFYADHPFTTEPVAGRRYYFDNDQFSYADAIFLYSMLRVTKPTRIVEVGAGFSTAVMLDTAERFLEVHPAITCIEPYPQRLQSLLAPGDTDRINLMSVGLASVETKLFSSLGASDILFVDSTHVSKLESDVNRLVFQILPMLASGVIVHFHDIFFPFEYPLRWVVENRAWNEAYLLHAFLCFNAQFEILLFNHFIAERHRDVLARDFPLCLRNPGGSLWLRRL